MLEHPTQPAIRAGFLVTLALSIGAAPAYCGDAVLYSIPPGWAPQTLNEWARQTHVQVSLDSKEMQHYRTRGIAATFRPLDALGAMLRDTPFTYHVINARTVAIIPGQHYCQPWLAEEAPLPPCVQMPEEWRAQLVRR